ncbi:MAG: DUF2752 domain-containing protein [Ilumatobacter sp.]|uniref:DUF2752 domain-containing protein n=1 Tax=Ilumatobacter sp. TaxID=1967498 RepID=UPI003C792332
MTVIGTDQEHDHDCQLEQSAPGVLREPTGSWLSRMVSSPWRIALLAVAAVLAIDAGGTDDGAGICVFRRCTGGYCPGCGLTRSARHLSRGEIGAAWQDHPIIVLLAIQGIAAAVTYAAIAGLRARLRSLRTLAVAAAANGILLLAIWVIRLVDGSIPRFF